MEIGRRGVVDGDLEAVEADILARSRLEGKRADEDPAVALRAELELEGQLIVVERFFVDEHVVAGVGIESPVLDMALRERLPLRAHPPGRRAAVEEELPAGSLLRRGELRIGGQGLASADGPEEGPEEENAKKNVVHLVHPSDHPGR